jgi:hypothetical protein
MGAVAIVAALLLTVNPVPGTAHRSDNFAPASRTVTPTNVFRAARTP